MEGLIPYLYRTFIHSRKGEQPSLSSRTTSWLGDPSSSPSYSYRRLPSADDSVSERYRVSAMVQKLFTSPFPPLPPTTGGAGGKSTTF